MGLFSTKKTTTNLSTTNVFTDQSANAAEGAIAVGAGANVSIESADKDIALGSLLTQRDTAIAGLNTTANVAGMALGSNERTAAAALAANRDVNLASLDTTSRLAQHTVNTVFGLAEIASRDRSDVLNTTTTALQSSAGITDRLAEIASGALERTQTPDSQTIKTLLYVIGAVASIIGLAFIARNRRTS
ncbi:MAG TPA: hypothetical protein VEB66_02315 [Opitutaceae bacterium]|nr:hypothetical protein [Opitutaceae bacterium]